MVLDAKMTVLRLPVQLEALCTANPSVKLALPRVLVSFERPNVVIPAKAGIHFLDTFFFQGLL